MPKFLFTIRARLIAGHLLMAAGLVVVALLLGQFIAGQSDALERLRQEQQGFLTLNRLGNGFAGYQAAVLSRESSEPQVKQAWADFADRLRQYALLRPDSAARIAELTQNYADLAVGLRAHYRAGADAGTVQAATTEMRGHVIALGTALRGAFDEMDQRYKTLLEQELSAQQRWRAGFRLGLALAAAFILFYGWFLGRAVLKPLAATVNAIRAVQAGEKPPALPARGEFAAVRNVLEELHKTSTAMHELAYTDALTGLGSRARLGQLLADSDRTGRGLALMLVDLPQLSMISSGHGPQVADQWLIAAARRMQGLLEPRHGLCRMGDARFALLLPDVRSSEVALHEAGELLQRVQGTLSIQGLSLRLEVRAGVACYGEDGRTPAELIAAAETALAIARQGDGRVLAAYDRAQAQRFRDDLELAQDIERGIEHGEFAPHYEPIVNLMQGRATALEALARWHHPQRGLLSPAAFLPLAESSGRITGIDAQILERVAADMVGWQAQHPDLLIGVNLSARDLIPATVSRIRSVLDAHQLKPERLVVEITETSMLHAGAEQDRVIATLHGLGIRICLDDFGTGYSSLSHLSRMPIGALKLDIAFVREIGRSPTAERIIESVLHLAQRLQAIVVAEGVETVQQMRWLLERGCIRQQGFLFTRSLPGPAVAAWLDQAPQQIAALLRAGP